MAADYPDVLDHLGKTPREFGSVHVHVEPVPRGADGAACATVYLQCAFEPLPAEGVIEVLRHRFPLPALAGGQVFKGRLPLAVPADTASLTFLVTCQLLPKAERVRQAWLLFDTHEAARNLGGGAGPDVGGAGGILLANVFTLPLGVAVIPTGGFGNVADDVIPGKVHKARELPPGFVAEVFSGEPARPSGPEWETLWSVGQPLPAAAASAWGNAPATTNAVLTGPSLRRSCSSCGFSGRREDFATDKSCPSCGYAWD